MLSKMERWLIEVLPGVGVEFLSYVDDLHYGLYDVRRGARALDREDRREQMEDKVERVLVVVKEVAAEWPLPWRRIRRSV